LMTFWAQITTAMWHAYAPAWKPCDSGNSLAGQPHSVCDLFLGGEKIPMGKREAHS